MSWYSALMPLSPVTSWACAGVSDVASSATLSASASHRLKVIRKRPRPLSYTDRGLCRVIVVPIGSMAGSRTPPTPTLDGHRGYPHNAFPDPGSAGGQHDPHA